MSISFNHPSNTVTSTGSLSLIVSGGNTTSPQPIRFNSTSVVMPVRALPAGEAGAMVFDTGTKTMKYHNGLSWVEMLGQDVILQPIYTEINNINNKLAGKVDTVTYSSGSVPQASISGSQLNIIFPIGGGGGTGSTGLFTSSKQGAIQYYSLTSGMNAATIREQMSGVTGGQAGRNGSQSLPWKTNDGWTFSDGMWWTWEGESGVVTRQVPNLNQNAYLKPMAVASVTNTTNLVASSASIGGTALSIAQLPPHSFTVSGQTNSAGTHRHGMSNLWSGRMSIDDVRVGVFRNGYNSFSATTSDAGDHFHTFSGTSNTIGSGQTHTHSINNLDVDHFTVAVLYNIATPSFALNEAAANSKYVLKSGDIMTGSLTIATSAILRGNDNNLTFIFRNTANAERAMIYHSSVNNTLRFRANGGTEMLLTSAGGLTVNTLTSSAGLTVTNNTATVGGKNIVRSINGQSADANGNITLAQGNYIERIRIFNISWAGVSESPVYPGTVMTGWRYGDKKELRGASYFYGYLQYYANGTWYTVAYQ
jgi:hypothetical protein